MLLESRKFIKEACGLLSVAHLLVLFTSDWSEQTLELMDVFFLFLKASEKLLGVWREMEQTAISCGQV